MSVADTYGNMGIVYRKQGDYERALFHYQNALEIYKKSVGDCHVSVADTKYNKALVYKRQGAIAQARRLFGEAGSIYSDAYGAAHSKTLEALRQALVAAPAQADAPVCCSCIVA